VTKVSKVTKAKADHENTKERQVLKVTKMRNTKTLTTKARKKEERVFS
jgi:hypothetical protein